jgi:hypothetical protein
MKSLNNMLLWFVLPCVTLVAGAAQSMTELLAATPQCAVRLTLLGVLLGKPMDKTIHIIM